MAKDRKRFAVDRLVEAERIASRWRQSIIRTEALLTKAEPKGDAAALKAKIAKARTYLARAETKAAKYRGIASLARRAGKAAEQAGPVMERWQAERKAEQVAARAVRKTSKRVRERERQALGTATPERLARAEGAITVGRADRVQRLSDAPLDRLRSRNAITPRQFEAGDIFRTHCHLAGTRSIGGIDPERPFASDPSRWASLSLMVSESEAIYRDKCRAALNALGPHLRPVVEEVVIAADAGTQLEEIGERLFARKGRGASIAAVIEVLRIALDTLADHYGLPSTDQRRRRRVWQDKDVQNATVREELWDKPS